MRTQTTTHIASSTATAAGYEVAFDFGLDSVRMLPARSLGLAKCHKNPERQEGQPGG